MKKEWSLRKIGTLAMFVALSLVMFILENQMPPLFFPGAKLGLSNIFSLAALVIFGPAEAVGVVVIRTLLGALITGSVSALIYSLSAGIVAVSVAAMLLRLPALGVVSVSVAAAVSHNLTQNAVYALVTGETLTLALLPYLALIGAASGLLVGAVVYLLIKHLPTKILVSVAGGGEIEKD